MVSQQPSHGDGDNWSYDRGSDDDDAVHMDADADADADMYDDADADADMDDDARILWGSAHHDQRLLSTHMKVSWSALEVAYIRHWMLENKQLPVRCLYEKVQTCDVARDIFHEHHVPLDRIDYMYKKIKKTLL